MLLQRFVILGFDSLCNYAIKAFAFGVDFYLLVFINFCFIYTNRRNI